MNPYPYFDDRWNQVLLGFCAANVIALMLPFVVPEGYVDLGHLSDASWVPGPLAIVTLFIFGACLLATLILWLNMWMYWARSGRPVLWMFLLLLGAWGPAIAFFFLVYRKDLEAFKQHDAEERRNLTHF
jgi:hypothetical protein